MITLHEDKSYYIMIDGQGANFGGGRICEGIEEIIETFQGWADSDGYEDPTLKGWSIGDCISNWTIDIKKYNGVDFVELSEEETNKTI